MNKIAEFIQKTHNVTVDITKCKYKKAGPFSIWRKIPHEWFVEAVEYCDGKDKSYKPVTSAVNMVNYLELFSCQSTKISVIEDNCFCKYEQSDKTIYEFADNSFIIYKFEDNSFKVG